jgi:hypothetical protein
LWDLVICGALDLSQITCGVRPLMHKWIEKKEFFFADILRAGLQSIPGHSAYW